MQVLFSVRKEQGRESTFIPKDYRSRHRDDLDPVIQEKDEWQSQSRKKLSLKNHQLLRRHGHTVGGAVTNGKKDDGKNTHGCKQLQHCKILRRHQR